MTGGAHIINSTEGGERGHQIANSVALVSVSVICMQLI
jgi:hypothetical protein